MYRSTRSNETGPEKLLKPFRPVRVRTHAPGVLRISGLAMSGETLWIEQYPLHYQAIDSPEYVVFRAGEQGQPVYLFEGNMPAAGYYRLPWYGTPQLHTALVIVCSLIFLATLVGHVWLAGHRLLGGSGLTSSLLVYLSAAAMSALNLAFIIALWIVMENVLQLLFGVPPLVRIVLLLPWMSLLMTALTLALMLHAWLTHTGSRAGRLHLTLTTLAGLVFLGMLIFWRLIQWDWVGPA